MTLAWPGKYRFYVVVLLLLGKLGCEEVDYIVIALNDKALWVTILTLQRRRGETVGFLRGKGGSWSRCNRTNFWRVRNRWHGTIRLYDWSKLLIRRGPPSHWGYLHFIYCIVLISHCRRLQTYTLREISHESWWNC